jgi:uncharacterized membrane protein affecting hemolysin expression
MESRVKILDPSNVFLHNIFIMPEIVVIKTTVSQNSTRVKAGQVEVLNDRLVRQWAMSRTELNTLS